MDNLCKIRDICRSISEFEEGFAKQFGITLNESMVLCSLQSSNSLSSGELAALLGLTCSNTSKVLKSVEKKEFIKRILGKSDKRQMYFSLTLKGIQKIESIKCEDIQMPEWIK